MRCHDQLVTMVTSSVFFLLSPALFPFPLDVPHQEQVQKGGIYLLLPLPPAEPGTLLPGTRAVLGLPVSQFSQGQWQ